MVSQYTNLEVTGASRTKKLRQPFTWIILLILGFTACSDPAPVGSDQAMEATPEVVITPPEQLKLYVFNGYIGRYKTNALMNLVFEGDSITGSYYYYKNLGRLTLNGSIDPVTNKIRLVESYKGKPTGYFRGSFSPEGLTGSWSATAAFDRAQGFEFELFKTSEVGTKPSAQLQDATYILEHGIEMWNIEEKVFEKGTTTDDITVRFIDDTAFTFDYNVSGHNGHSGRIAGIGKMLNLNQGIFNGEEGCELIFDFYDKRVDINAERCQEYAGQRAHFGGSLKKK